MEWREQDHPRDRAGRFTDGGDWVARLDARIAGSPVMGQPAAPAAAPRAGLSPRTRELIDRAVSDTPQTKEGWRAPVEATPRRGIDAAVDEYQEAVDDLRRQVAANPDHQATRDFLESMETLLEQAKARRQFSDAQLKAIDPDLARPVYGPGGKYLYPRGPHGEPLPPPEYEEHLDQVLGVGAAIQADLAEAIENDPELVAAREALAGYEVEAMIGDRAAASRARTMARSVGTMVRRREKQILQQLLADARAYGNREHSKKIGADGPTVRRVIGRHPELGQLDTARPDWETHIRAAEAMYPDDWIGLSAGTPLLVGSSPRAYHVEMEGATMIAMDREDTDSPYYGGYGSHTEEITTHEMGHRMEVVVPGLREMEFTLVRRRAGAGAKPKKIRDLSPGGGYTDAEVTYEDMWRDPYTGKTYEAGSGGDPSSVAWEVFQVGMQDTFSRRRVYGDDELEAFTLGVLTVLGRG